VSDTLDVVGYEGAESWILNGQQVRLVNSAHGTHDYHPLYHKSLVRNDLGNLGSAEHVVLLDADRNFGFQFRNARPTYWRSLESRTLLVSDKMFSRVSYVNGANREILLNAELTRNLGSLLNLGFEFDRLNSNGFYDRQRNLVTDLFIYSTFRTKDSRYKAVLLFNYTDLDVEENGGLKVDSVFEKNLTSGREFIPTNLSVSKNRWKGFEIGLEHQFLLVKEDTAATGAAKKYRPALSHSFYGGRSSMVYRGAVDTILNFYEHSYLDSSFTYDSTDLLKFKNTLRVELIRSDSLKIGLLQRISVGAMHEYYRVAYDSLKTPINNIGVLADVRGTIYKGLYWSASGNFMVFGYNLLDLKVNGRLRYKVKRSSLEAFVDYSLYHPDFITDYYVSNHFIWDNSFGQTQHWKTGAVFSQNRLRLNVSVTYHLFDRLVVFGTDRLPYQSSTVNQLLVARANEHFVMRWFHLTLDGALQWKVSGGDIRVPLALGRGMFYYQNDLFKRRLRMQIGVEVSYSTSYLANGYNPALSAFYIQNDKQVGNYPYIDVFLNLRVKKFRAFVKVEHMNAGWLGYRYYMVPHYPANDLAWKFGINWAFFD